MYEEIKTTSLYDMKRHNENESFLHYYLYDFKIKILFILPYKLSMDSLC